MIWLFTYIVIIGHWTPPHYKIRNTIDSDKKDNTRTEYFYLSSIISIINSTLKTLVIFFIFEISLSSCNKRQDSQDEKSSPKYDFHFSIFWGCELDRELLGTEVVLMDQPKIVDKNNIYF